MPKRKPNVSTGQLPLNQSHARSLDEILGTQGRNPYKEKTVEDYKNSLADMNMADLQAHAVELFVIPRDDRDVLTRSLIKEFEKKVVRYETPTQQSTVQGNNKEQLLKILYEGK